MGTLKNTATLEKLKEYLENTNFGNQQIGHRLTLGFLPKPLDTSLEDVRYTFDFKHRLLHKDASFKKVTYSEAIVKLIISMNVDLKDRVSKQNLKIYTDAGLIDNDMCTKELISTVIGNGVVMYPSKHTGNTTNTIKRSDNLQNVFDEFRPKVISYFLDNLDKYKPVV